VIEIFVEDELRLEKKIKGYKDLELPVLFDISERSGILLQRI
jgi:hypothetical protein|tara:strand:+ start:3594 stop:3719 length:126 start_codon:yes stop_codon:yes gene_type:complete